MKPHIYFMDYDFSKITLRGIDSSLPQIMYDGKPILAISLFKSPDENLNKQAAIIRKDIFNLIQTLVKTKITIQDASINLENFSPKTEQKEETIKTIIIGLLINEKNDNILENAEKIYSTLEKLLKK